MRKILLFAGLLAVPLMWSPAEAQQTVITQPQGVNTLNRSGTIAVTNTFQSIFAASTNTRGRTACVVQNTGTNSMYVFFGPIASATIAKSVKLAAGQSASCATGAGGVLKDQVSITGTATEAFYAAEQ